MALVAFAEAKAALLASARPSSAEEEIGLDAAYGRVLAQPVTATLAVPPFAAAAMDGYAVRAADVVGPGTRLPLAGRSAAGDAPQALPPGTALRIMTGGVLPAGADAVIMQEDCRAEGDSVLVQATAVPGQPVRAAGSSGAAGEMLLARGDLLSAAAMGLAASVGLARLRVFRRLRVAMFSTGAELREPGETLAPGQIYNSNRYVIRGYLEQLGAEIIDGGIVADSLAATREALRRAAPRADVILSSGGMSQGEEDHVTAAVRAEGRIDVWQIAAKPGKPLAFGAVAGVPFIGLPGNPVAVWVGMLTLVTPFLRRMQNCSQAEAPHRSMRADFAWTVAGGRLEFVRVRCNEGGGLDLFPNQDSAVIRSAAWCDGVACLPAGSRTVPGDMVEYWPGPVAR